MCDHQFSYIGVRYCDGTRSMPGTGACPRYYAHVYYCTKCLETRGTSIRSPRSSDGRTIWNTYQNPPSFNATPGTPDECGVPLEDR